METQDAGTDPQKEELQDVERKTPAGVDAQRQTGRGKGANASTQTPIVHHSDQETQTEGGEGESPPQEEDQKKPDLGSAEEPSADPPVDPPADLSASQSGKGADQKTYAKVVSGGGGAKGRVDEDKPAEPPQEP